MRQVESDTEWEEADTECGDVSEVGDDDDDDIMNNDNDDITMIMMRMIADW